jgi:hypothetical protein
MNLVPTSLDSLVTDAPRAGNLNLTPELSSMVGVGSRQQAIAALRIRYQGSSRSARGEILSALCNTFGYHRKHAVRLMSNVREIHLGRAKSSRQMSKELQSALAEIGSLSGLVGARRLKLLLAEWLPSYRAAHPELTDFDARRLLKISHATIGRIQRKGPKVIAHEDMRLAHAELRKLTTASLYDLTPCSLGCIFAREVMLCEGGIFPVRKALCAIDALSGWTVLVPFESSVAVALQKVEEKLPFPIHCLHLQATTAEVGVAARAWAWDREEAIAYSFLAIDAAEKYSLEVASKDSERLINFGIISLSPHAPRSTAAAIVRQALGETSMAVSLAEEQGQLYSSAIQALEMLGGAVNCHSSQHEQAC